MKELLKFLSWKKGAIASILGAIFTYMASEGLIDWNMSILIWTIMTIVFGTTSYATKKILNRQ